MKIVFFDIDGTLIDVPHQLYKPTLKTVTVLKEFQRQGNLIFVCSARGEVPDCLNEIDFDGVILCDGQYIEYKNEVLKDFVFDKDQINFVRDVVVNNDGCCHFNGHYGSYFYDINDCMMKHIHLYNKDFKLPSYQDRTIPIHTITAVFNNKDDICNALDQLPKDWKINAYVDDLVDIRMDIHTNGFSKGEACQFVCNHLNIKDSYAFGDGYNDIEMLKLVNTGIAMGNANEDVKSIADDVTLSVLDDGIAYSFNKYFHIDYNDWTLRCHNMDIASFMNRLNVMEKGQIMDCPLCQKGHVKLIKTENHMNTFACDVCDMRIEVNDD
jgi:hypothetical protein